MEVIIAIVLIIVFTIVIVWVIDKFVPKKLKPILNILLWAFIIFLGYITYMSVYKELQFNELKDKRYSYVIDRLVDIRDSQLAYKDVNGEYAESFDKLIKFVDTGRVPITQRRDTLVLDEEKTKLFGGVETFKTITLIDTLSYYTVKDSIFKGDDRYKTMMNVGVGKEGGKFVLKAGKLEDIPVFEASVDKAILLDGEEPYLIEKERQAFSVAGVKGETVRIGSMEEVKTSGNWGKDLSNKE